MSIVYPIQFLSASSWVRNYLFCMHVCAWGSEYSHRPGIRGWKLLYSWYSTWVTAGVHRSTLWVPEKVRCYGAVKWVKGPGNQRAVCLGEGNLEEVTNGGSRSQTCAETPMGFGGLFRCMCVGVYKEVFASKWSGTVPPETHLSTFQLLESLGSRDSYRPVLVSEPSCCRDLHCAYVCINFPSNRLPPCSAKEGRKRRHSGTSWVHVSPLCVCLWSAWPALHIHTLVVYKCALFASAYCKYRLRLMAGCTQGGMELQWPHPCQATVLNISLSNLV